MSLTVSLSPAVSSTAPPAMALPLVLALVVLSAMAPPAALAGSEPTPPPAVMYTTAPQGAPYEPGGMFTVDVALGDNVFGPVNSFSIRVYYAPEHVTFVRAEDVDLRGNSPTWNLWGTENDGRHWRLIRSPGAPHNTLHDLTLFRLVFTTADPAPSAIHITLGPAPDEENLLRNPDYGAIPHVLDSTASDPLPWMAPPTPTAEPSPTPPTGEDLHAWYRFVYRSGGRIVDPLQEPDRLIVDGQGVFIPHGAPDDTLSIRLWPQHRGARSAPTIPAVHAPAGLQTLASDGPIGAVMSAGAVTRLVARGIIDWIDVGQARDIRVVAPAPAAPGPAFVRIAQARPWANARQITRPTTIRLAGMALGELDAPSVEFTRLASASKVFIDRDQWPPARILSPGGLGDGRHDIAAGAIGQMVAAGGDISPRNILVQGAIGQLTATRLALAGQTPGGAIGLPDGPPEALLVATGLGADMEPPPLRPPADMGLVQATRSIHGVFYAGADRMGDGSVRPNHAGLLRRMTVARGGALAGEIHLSPEGQGRFPIFMRPGRFASNAMAPIYAPPIP